MCAENHKAGFSIRQFLVKVVILDLHIEFPAAEHIEAIEDDLRKTAEVAINAKESPDRTTAQSPVKIMIHRLVALGKEKIEGYHKNGHEAVHQSQRHITYDTHEGSVHP